MNLKLKETVAKIVDWLKGGTEITTSDNLRVAGAVGKEVGLRARSSNGTGDVYTGVGSGGVNHGVYSWTMNRWMVHSDGTHTYIDQRKLDLETNNTSDTWVPVLSGQNIQHRVIPRDIMTTRQKTVTIMKQHGASNSISADTISGYTFVCWLQPATSGWVGGIYVENPTSASTKIWMCTPTQVAQPGNVVVTALYKANF